MDPNLLQRRVGSGTTLQNEFLLQGSVLDESRDALLHKLRGFCDNSDVPPQPFQDHEMSFVISVFITIKNSVFLVLIIYCKFIFF